MKCAVLRLLSLFYLFALTLTPAVASDQAREEQLGREYSKQVEEQSKLVEDKAITDRINRIGNALAKIANENKIKARYGHSEIYKFNYVFKVIDDKDVNAFSLPGGIIYINSGLIDMASSDDEIAGVIAHEIAHSAHHHMTQLIRKQNAVDKYVALIALAGILSNMRSNDLNNLLYGAQMMKTGKMNGYTMEAEKDADRTAVAYLAKSPYKAEGMLTFMKKLEEQSDANPGASLGIYQTHPAPFRRVASIMRAIKDEGIDIDFRKVRGIVYAKTVPSPEDDTRYDVMIGKKVVYCPAGIGSGPSSKERADALACTINKLLDSGIKSHELSEDKTSQILLARGQEVLKIDAADALLMREDSATLINKAKTAIEYAIWADWLCDRCPLVQMEYDAESD